MSASSNEGVKSEEKPAAAAPPEDEEETETNKNVANVEVAERNKGVVIAPSSDKSKLLDCCKQYYSKILSTTPGAKASERDALIAKLQNQLKNMETRYLKAIDEQQDIKRKYAQTVERLSKAEVPQVELPESKKVEATPESIHLDNLRMEVSTRLENAKVKPKKCCKYLYEALGVEIPEKKPNKKVPKSERKSSEASGASKKAYIDDKEMIEECKKVCSDLNRTEKSEKPNVDLTPKIKEQKPLECREICKKIHPPLETKAPLDKFSLQKELSSQVAVMEAQEKDLNDLQDKLKKLCSSMEGLERSRTSASKPQTITVDSPMKIKPLTQDARDEKYALPQKTAALDISCYERCVEDFRLPKRPLETSFNLKSSGESSGMKPDKKESTETKPDKKGSTDKKVPRRRSSRCCKRATSQESRKKLKPEPKEVDSSSPPKDLKLEDDKCCNLIVCPTSKATVPPKTPSEEALCFAPPEESSSEAPKITEVRPVENFPCYDKCIGDKINPNKGMALHPAAPPEKKEEQPAEKTTKQAKSIDEGALKDPTPQSDKKEKKKSRCCSWKKSKSQENFGDKSEEHCDCGVGNCPVKKEQRGVVHKEESTCCDFDDCPSNKEAAWGFTKSQEIRCCDLESCTKHDAHTSTCDEKCPNFRAGPKAKRSPPESPKRTKAKDDARQKDLEDALKANKDLEAQIEAQKLAAAQKDGEVEDLQNQLKDILLKNNTLLCTFGCQLDELRAGYESAQNEMSRIKENREALNQNVEKLKAEHELALKEKLENETNELQRKADSDSRALRICESKYNELKSEYEYFKEKVAVSDNQCVLLRQEIADLKDALDKSNRENKELQSCKLECDKMKDQCFQECKMLKAESKRKATQLEDVQQERDDLLRENSEQISSLENRILNLSGEGVAMQEENARLSEQLEAAKDGLRHLRNSVGGLAEDKSNLEDELAENQRKIRQLEQELEGAKEEKEKAENVYKIEICNLECYLEEQKSCFEDALDKLQKAKDDNNLLAQDLEKLEDEHIALNGDLETWKRKYEGDVGGLRKDLEEAREELGRAEGKIKENEEQLENTKSQYDHKLFELINKYNISQRELQDHQEDQEMLQEKLAASVNELEKVKGEMAERVKESEQERGEKEKLRRELDRSTNDFYDNQKALEEAREELACAQEKLKENEEQLQNTKSQYDHKLFELINKYNISQRELLDHQEDQEMLQGKLAASLNELEKVKGEMAERVKESEQERGEKEKLRRELDRSTSEFHDKQKTLEEALEALEQARQEKTDVENDLKLTICNYECKINELSAAQEPAAALKEEMNQVAQENQKLKARLAEKDGDSEESKNTIAGLKKELEDLRAAKTEADKNNGKIEKLSADYEEAQAEIPRLSSALGEVKNAKAVGSLERKKENETEVQSDLRTKCVPECKRRCTIKPPDLRLQRARREECRKSCGALRKIGESQEQFRRPQVDPSQEKKLLCKTDQPLHKECRDLCAELNSIKKMLSDIEIVSTPKPTMVMETNESQLISATKVSGQKIGVRKSSSWKEEYEKTAQERDELKQEISHMYNKLKEVMKELESKLNV